MKNYLYVLAGLFICSIWLSSAQSAWFMLIGNGAASCDDDCSGTYGDDSAGEGYWNYTTYETVLEKVTLTSCEGASPTIYGGFSNGNPVDEDIRWVIYDDDGPSGEPLTLLWSGTDLVDASESGARYSLATSTGCLTGDVWVGAQSDSATVNWEYTSSGGTGRKYTSASFAVEDPWPHATDATSTYMRHIYLVY